jgi:copper chaperone NosL
MVTRRRFLGILGAVATVGAAGVAGIQLLPGETVPTGDPVIRYGQENCARCRMAISDARFAAAWRDPAGKEAHFDDIGCMVLLQGEKNPAAGTRFWVHDYVTEAWLDAQSASYAISESIRSPMSYGVAASATADGAQRIVKESTQVTVTRWEALGTSLVKRG